ncbi:hypothetical protein [Jiangella ureilytica]|uniref:hypothetical protein n=1 Tax=Jiangella ureilytica TaxID=2530374 RepID=UPI0013A5EFB6|nr:hypothetical protein [Jiangella ureilytica]
MWPSSIAAAVTAGGNVVDDRQGRRTPFIADQDGDNACVCTAASSGEGFVGR